MQLPNNFYWNGLFFSSFLIKMPYIWVTYNPLWFMTYWWIVLLYVKADKRFSSYNLIWSLCFKTLNYFIYLKYRGEHLKNNAWTSNYNKKQHISCAFYPVGECGLKYLRRMILSSFSRILEMQIQIIIMINHLLVC